MKVRILYAAVFLIFLAALSVGFTQMVTINKKVVLQPVVTRTGLIVAGMFGGLDPTPWGKRMASSDLKALELQQRSCGNRGALKKASWEIADGILRRAQECYPEGDSACYGHYYTTDWAYRTCSGDPACMVAGAILD